MPSEPAISKYGLQRMFNLAGIAPSALRTDRLLNEAAETADPIHLMRIFSISSATAIKYVKAAHPELFTTDPTQA